MPQINEINRVPTWYKNDRSSTNHLEKRQAASLVRLAASISLAGVALVANSASAAIDYGAAGEVYSQNFDSLASAPTTPAAAPIAWVNNSTIPGFYVFNSGSVTAGTGRIAGKPDNVPVGSWAALDNYTTGTSNTGGRLYSFGGANATDRALGSISGNTARDIPNTNNANPGDFFYALVFRNNTGAQLDSFTLSYTGEQWREQTGGIQTVQFDYLIKTDFNAAADIPTANGFGDYTENTNLDFIAPAGTTNQSINGNSDAYSTPLSATISASWAAGDYLILRFLDEDDTGTDQGLAFDDLTFSASASAVPEPASLSLVMIACIAVAARRRRSR